MSMAPQPDDEHHDPTGVRALLAGLPDPGPMPEDLVRRIEARLAVERAHLDAQAGESARTGGSARQVLDLTAERSRRRPGRMVALMGAAAAGLAVVTIGANQLLGETSGGSDPGTAAHYPSLDDSADAAAPDESATLQEGTSPGSGDHHGSSGAAERAGEDTLGGSAVQLMADVTVLPGLGTVEEDVTGTAMLALAQDPGRPTPGIADLTSSEATSCWHGPASQRPWDRYYAASAVLADEEPHGGQQVVVLLGLDDSGAGQTWVMPQACTSTPGAAPLTTSPLIADR